MLVALNNLLSVVAGLLPATSLVRALSQIIGVAGTSPATTGSGWRQAQDRESSSTVAKAARNSCPAALNPGCRAVRGDSEGQNPLWIFHRSLVTVHSSHTAPPRFTKALMP